MKRSYLFAIASVLAWGLTSCGQPSSTETSTDTKDTVLISVGAEKGGDTTNKELPPIIDGCYASNTDVAIEGNSVLNVLDGRATTRWQTPKGAGLYEGVMLYFTDSIYISEATVDFQIGKEYFFKPLVRVFSNGLNLADGKNINRKVQSLYFRFSVPFDEMGVETAHSTQFSQGIYDTTLCLAVQEIKCRDSQGKLIDFVIPKVVKGSIKASTTLSPKASYSAAFLTDGRYDFAWAEGAEGNGQGEQIDIALDEAITIDRIMIRNGYQRSDNHYQDNARLASFSLSTSANTSIGSFPVQDVKEVFIDVPITTSNTFTLNVQDVFKGGKYKDLVISEIRFYQEGQPYMIETSHEQETMMANQKAANALLGSFLDKSITARSHSIKEADYFIAHNNTSRSLILRSNGSFVFYGEESFYEEEESDEIGSFTSGEEVNTTVADGGWELIDQNDEEVTVRIFGKIFLMTTNEELYRSSVEYSDTKVFQDYITLSTSEIKSKTTFETMQITW